MTKSTRKEEEPTFEGIKHVPIDEKQNYEIMDEYDEHGKRVLKPGDNKQGDSEGQTPRVPPIALPTERDLRSEFTMPNEMSARISVEKVVDAAKLLQQQETTERDEEPCLESERAPSAKDGEPNE